MMNRKGCGRKRPWPNLRYYSSICLEGLRNITKNFIQDTGFPGQNLNPVPPEYEAGVLTTGPQRLVAPCFLVELYRRFRGAKCLRHQYDESHRPDDGGSTQL
jgi:hypothetical protein